MKVYERLVSSYFRSGRSGEELFYPRHSFGQGYVVPTAGKSAQIRHALQRHFRIWMRWAMLAQIADVFLRPVSPFVGFWTLSLAALVLVFRFFLI